jgi:hypothetical protein
VTHYRFQLAVECVWCDSRAVTIEVRDGAVVFALDADGNQMDKSTVGKKGKLRGATTMEGLFEIATNAFFKAHKATISYNPRYGFPSLIDVDWSELTHDENVYRVSYFEALN